MQPKRSSMQRQDSGRVAMPRRRPGPTVVRGEPTGADKRPSEPTRVLIVEDDFLVSTQMEAALEDAGFEIAGVAISAEEAVRLATARAPDLVVMDIRLSGSRDGIDTAIELFSVHGIRCVFATAHSDPDARRRAAPAAPLGWLQKPYSMASLVAAVEQALNDLAD